MSYPGHVCVRYMVQASEGYGSYFDQNGSSRPLLLSLLFLFLLLDDRCYLGFRLPNPHGEFIGSGPPDSIYRLDHGKNDPSTPFIGHVYMVQEIRERQLSEIKLSLAVFNYQDF
jgi:hypothetical protein